VVCVLNVNIKTIVVHQCR